MKKRSLVLCLILCSLFVFGCDQKNAPTQSPSTATATKEPKFETITIFTIDTANMQITPNRVKKNEDNDSLSYICDLVEDNLDDDSIHVAEAFTETDKKSDDTAVIVFDKGGKPLKDCTEEMEYLILDCFANSILDNVTGCHKVVFRSSDGAYKSENVEFGKDEAYASK